MTAAVLKVGPWRRMGKYVGRDVYLLNGKRTTELQHRAIVAEREGRTLRTDEHVHHQDEVKSNNDPANLELLTHAEHTRHHFGTGRTMLDLVCDMCGSSFRVDIRRRNAKTCSRACAGKRSGQRSAVARRARLGTAQPGKLADAKGAA